MVPIRPIMTAACVAIMVTASSFAAFADSSSDSRLSPDNPNCSPGVKGCTANYPTSDQSAANPTANAPYDHNQNPNCTHGDRDCSANYPTTEQAPPPAPAPAGK